EAKSFFEKVRQGYLEIAQRDPDRVRVIDASVPLVEVQRQIEGVLSRFLGDVDG
ncbi:MAG: dTMP kinase, partial [Candidatus Thiodiazotropha sp.]